MNINTFSFRLALLLVLMLVVSLVDFYRNGTQATRFREYSFVLIAGALSGAFGFVNDLITASISPDYFILGKGLDEGPDLRLRAALFGVRGGLSAGVIGGALCLYAARRKSVYPPINILRLLQMLLMPVTGAILCGVALPLAFSKFDPAHFAAQLSPLLSTDRIDRFREVWWTHVGLYAGLIVGLATIIVRVVKERKHLTKER